jgi:hypothetical protein
MVRDENGMVSLSICVSITHDCVLIFARYYKNECTAGTQWEEPTGPAPPLTDISSGEADVAGETVKLLVR